MLHITKRFIAGLVGFALASAASAATTTATVAPRVGQVFMTVDEALKLAFPEAEVSRETCYLTDAERARVKKVANVDFDKGVVFPYVARKKGAIVGTAYFDTHRVRTLRETIMVVVKPDDTIDRIEVLSFGEPVDYVPRAIWYGQFCKKKLDRELDLNRGIRGVTGATLTARATTESARRVLALHKVLGERPPKEREKVAHKGANPKR